MRIGCGLSTGSDQRLAAIEAGQQAHAALEGARADVVCVFASGAHLAAPEATLEGVHEALAPPVLVGCGAGGVVGDGREIERGTAVAVWAAALGGGRAEAFHLDVTQGGRRDRGRRAARARRRDRASSCSPIPTRSRPTSCSASWRAAPRASRCSAASPARARSTATPPCSSATACAATAPSASPSTGVEVMPCVSQGAAPVGPELTVTAADGHVIRELAGRPALETLREAIEGLDPHQQALVASGLLLGIVIGGGKPEYEQGDFLVRGVIGADPEAGTLTVGARVQEGTVVRLHARDAVSADLDLRAALCLRREALGGGMPAGALVFTCNGRGEAMFGTPDHDAITLDEELAGAPAAGFFAAGEIGPVGGDPFLHGFTATVAVFPP